MSAIFTPAEHQTLRDAVDRIIPADEYPSGWEAGVGDFIERLIAREPRLLPIYQAGLRDIESQEFFALLVEHVMEGYYADPGNGGNKDGVAWCMIGYKVTA